jgi:hypothetical protein
MINNQSGQHPALDTITRITTDSVRLSGWLLRSVTGGVEGGAHLAGQPRRARHLLPGG